MNLTSTGSPLPKSGKHLFRCSDNGLLPVPHTPHSGPPQGRREQGKEARSARASRGEGASPLCNERRAAAIEAQRAAVERHSQAEDKRWEKQKAEDGSGCKESARVDHH